MNKTTKGAIAAGTAAVLLLGGAGTLAFWTDSETVDGGSVSSGELTLSAVSCGDAWTHTEDQTPVTTIVPGDTVSKQCTGTLDLVGDHIGATVEITDASLSSVGGLADELTVNAQMTSPAATITEPGTYDVTIAITVEFPYGEEDNDSQLDTATLDALELTAVQTHDTAA